MPMYVRTYMYCTRCMDIKKDRCRKSDYSGATVGSRTATRMRDARHSDCVPNNSSSLSWSLIPWFLSLHQRYPTPFRSKYPSLTTSAMTYFFLVHLLLLMSVYSREKRNVSLSEGVGGKEKGTRKVGKGEREKGKAKVPYIRLSISASVAASLVLSWCFHVPCVYRFHKADSRRKGNRLWRQNERGEMLLTGQGQYEVIISDYCQPCAPFLGMCSSRVKQYLQYSRR